MAICGRCGKMRARDGAGKPAVAAWCGFVQNLGDGFDGGTMVRHRLRLLGPTLAALAATIGMPASAEGFAVREIAELAGQAAAVLGAGFERSTTESQVVLHCEDCVGEPLVALSLGRQADGTEQRVRSGQTRIATLEEQCKARDPSCELSALSVSPAVGWISSWSMGGRAGATAVVLRDGDLLTIRVLAADAASAGKVLDALVQGLIPKVVGA
ncbi:hypothetical protein ACBY01_12475 [Sphingomonas sp. ac-8]|uniref:hypothetical protein n=1 Tax=Sphingomonas sp. ac-8 TaxID=3242977 RepID=UPI003A8133BF